MPRIREAALTDAKAINFLSTGLGYPLTPDHIAQDRLAKILNSNSDRVWVFEAGTEVVGWLHAFLAVRVASETFVEIAGLVVDPLNKKQGIGRQLVAQSRSWAQEQGISLRVRCSSVREDTHAFYEKVGFSKVKQQYVFDKNL